jgi:oligosaccharide repeat unit polymerase
LYSLRNSLFLPEFFFPALWILYFITTKLFYPSSFAGLVSILFLISFILSFYLGTKSVYRNHDKRIIRRNGSILNPRFVQSIIIIGTISNFFASFLILSKVGFVNINLVSLVNLVGEISVARYSDAEYGDLRVAVLAMLSFVGSLIAPLIKFTKIRSFWIWLPALSSMLPAIFSSARLPFLINFSFTLSGMLVVYIYKNGRPPRLSLRLLFNSTLFGMFAFVSFVGINVLRAGDISVKTVQIILSRQQLYIFGQIPAFDQWLNSILLPSRLTLDPTLGSLSIAGVEKLTKIDKESLLRDFIIIDPEGRMTNVYTIFSQIISDFTIVGGFIVVFFLGIVMQNSYKNLSKLGSMGNYIVLSFLYSYCFFTIAISITLFTNVIGAVIISVILMSFIVFERIDGKEDILDA